MLCNNYINLHIHEQDDLESSDGPLSESGSTLCRVGIGCFIFPIYIGI